MMEKAYVDANGADAVRPYRRKEAHSRAWPLWQRDHYDPILRKQDHLAIYGCKFGRMGGG
jgi:hypothetical protein